MDAVLHEISDLTEEFEIRTLCCALQRIALEERYDRTQDISLRAYRIAIALTVIGALFLLKIHRSAPYRVPYSLKQFSVAFLHLQMKMQLHAETSLIS